MFYILQTSVNPLYYISLTKYMLSYHQVPRMQHYNCAALLTVNKLVVCMNISWFCALSYVYYIVCISALLICTKLYLQCTDVSKLDLLVLQVCYK